jgi:hypothetical protein
MSLKKGDLQKGNESIEYMFFEDLIDLIIHVVVQTKKVVPTRYLHVEVHI